MALVVSPIDRRNPRQGTNVEDAKGPSRGCEELDISRTKLKASAWRTPVAAKTMVVMCDEGEDNSHFVRAKTDGNTISGSAQVDV